MHQWGKQSDCNIRLDHIKNIARFLSKANVKPTNHYETKDSIWHKTSIDTADPMRHGIESKLSSSKAWTQIDQELPGNWQSWSKVYPSILDAVPERGQVCTATTYYDTISDLTHALKDPAFFSNISSRARYNTAAISLPCSADTINYMRLYREKPCWVVDM